MLAPGIVLDARRAVWLEETGMLAVADTHIGYAWAHRHAGNLLPLSAGEDVLPRLLELVESYAPSEVAILGDIVHRAVSVAPLREALCELCSELSRRATVRLVAGNHDRHLAKLLTECGVEIEIEREVLVGPHLLAHGDAPVIGEAATGGWIFTGHDHPAITLSDGAGTSAKCPCFWIEENRVVLPAFSSWAAGGEVRRPGRAIAVMGGRLLALR